MQRYAIIDTKAFDCQCLLLEHQEERLVVLENRQYLPPSERTSWQAKLPQILKHICKNLPDTKFVFLLPDSMVIHLTLEIPKKDGVQEEDFGIKFWADGVNVNMDSVIVLAVSQVPGANTVEVSQHINAMLPQLYEALPPSITLQPIYDKAKSILESINEVKETIVIAFILVALVIFLFLGRARETIIPVIAMPLSLLITFLVMKALGYSLDNLSLMALTLAIGFLVDDAIVFLENVVRHMEEGLTPLEAAFKGASEISFTILSMTFSLMATFIPIIFMDGQIGRVFREFSVTIVVAILASGIVSLTVTPVMCARFLKKHKQGDKTTVERFAYNFEHTFLAWYRKRLAWFLNHRWISWWAWTACVIMMVFLFVRLPKSFLPAGDSSAMFGMFMAQCHFRGGFHGRLVSVLPISRIRTATSDVQSLLYRFCDL